MGSTGASGTGSVPATGKKKKAPLLMSLLSGAKKYKRPVSTVSPAERERLAREKAAEERERQRLMAFRATADANVDKIKASFAANPAMNEALVPLALDRPLRAVLHEVCDTKGLGAVSYGDDPAVRHMVIYRKELTPNEDHVDLLRNLHPSEFNIHNTLGSLHRELACREARRKELEANASRASAEEAARAAAAAAQTQELELSKLVPRERDRRTIEEIELDLKKAKRAREAAADTDEPSAKRAKPLTSASSGGTPPSSHAIANQEPVSPM
ncbi:uncharacterized protein AMSG_02256 [Thecamonas trahens ATCC 50062]|uniref:R3H domain-containing protein n=1 Tax=Thecamonas trahens ATCC 50062 TaxID=461836 RepID=A0A0L0DVT1_THETB|nr:hypothetical protein AMSG_02256 [Thecamonas trahens ATCC 50062]KNC56287.1 hypothetical protein AMSG_02256 [Thecamonas trahens ATCC 50062]|eukprot:XP_013760806.1 hypothetical protein AMSG_02256 [Thecamonas trahens ATCC 50062]